MSLMAVGRTTASSGDPYDCRHMFASLLIHEGRSAVFVAE